MLFRSKFLSQEHADYSGLFNSEPHGFGLLGLLLWLWVVAIKEGALFGVLLIQTLIYGCCVSHSVGQEVCHSVP